jgi:hypothetical protein
MKLLLLASLIECEENKTHNCKIILFDNTNQKYASFVEVYNNYCI